MIFLRSIERLSGEPESYTNNPFAIPRLVSLRTLAFTAPVTFFSGENASASTLLEALALRARLPMTTQLPPEHEPSLASSHRLARNLNLHWSPKTQYGAYLRACDLHGRGTGSMELLREQCVAGGLHLLDTPECALPPRKQTEFLTFLKNLVDENAQFIIATNSPIILAFPDAQILDFDQPQIAGCEYDEVPVVKFMRSFLAAPDEFVWKL